MSTRATEKADAALAFLALLWRANHAMHRVSSRMVETLGLTGPQRLALRLIGKRPGLTAGDLALGLHLDRGTVSAMLGRLEARQLIERRVDAADRRRVIVTLTPVGRRYDRPDDRTVEGVVGAVLATASAAEIRAAEGMLRRVASACERVADEPRPPPRRRR